jgi:hypothetical protein
VVELVRKKSPALSGPRAPVATVPIANFPTMVHPVVGTQPTIPLVAVEVPVVGAAALEEGAAALEEAVAALEEVAVAVGGRRRSPAAFGPKVIVATEPTVDSPTMVRQAVEEGGTRMVIPLEALLEEAAARLEAAAEQAAEAVHLGSPHPLALVERAAALMAEAREAAPLAAGAAVGLVLLGRARLLPLAEAAREAAPLEETRAAAAHLAEAAPEAARSEEV